MIYQSKNETKYDRIRFKNITDMFFKKKKYYFLEKNIDLELTHEPPKYNAELIMNKIM